jgi:uncharacterized protein (TIGR00251 family)
VARIAVRLQPRASRDEIARSHAGVVVVRVTAPPVEGKANDALRRLLAKRTGVAPSRVKIVRGQTTREKLVEVEGLDDAELRTRLALS